MAETVHKTRTPCRTAGKKLVEKFELLEQVSDVKNKTLARRSRIADNIAAVAESVEENPGLLIPRRSLKSGITKTSLHRFLHKDLDLEAYKVQVTREIKPIINNNVVSLIFCGKKFRTVFSLEEVITIIGHRGCDLTPCDFFLWGHVKEKFYANSPESIEDLKDGIREAIEDKGSHFAI